MLTFSKLEKKGNLGNQLFQISSVIGIATVNQQQFSFPKWSYQSYFENELPILENLDLIHLQEKSYHYESIVLDDKNYDLEGWFQSEKYFDRELTKKYFTFKSDIVSAVKQKSKKALLKKPILISIRRGDFVDHPDYFQLPVNYYINALNTEFDDWRDRNLIFLSDDIDYCRFHFSYLENAFFGDSLSGLEQLVLGSLCDDFIISNSTFSWWCAWLGEKDSSTIIRPPQNFSTNKNCIDNDKDYFPDRWKIFKVKDNRIDLGDTIVVLPRKSFYLEEYLKNNFIFSGEIINLNSFQGLVNISKMFYIDDFVIPPLSLYESVRAINNKQKSLICCPLGKILSISSLLDYRVLRRQFDFGIFTKVLQKNCSRGDRKILFFCTYVAGKIDGIAIRKLVTDIDAELGGHLFFSYAGKINGLLSCRYFLKIQTENQFRNLKKAVKNILKIQKK